MTTIEILDREQGYFSPELKEMLRVIGPFGEDLEWYVVEFEPAFLLGSDGLANQHLPGWIRELLDEVRMASSGVRIDWTKLREFSMFVGQTESALLIATKPGEAAPVEPIDLNNPVWEIVLQAFDASLWAVTSSNQALLDAITTAFRQTKVVASASRYY